MSFKWLVLGGLATATLGTYVGLDLVLKKQKELFLQTKSKGKQTQMFKQVSGQSSPILANFKNFNYLQEEEHFYSQCIQELQNLTKIKTTKEFPLYKICLTGGPCAGKTTGLSHLQEKLTEKRFQVYTVPEIPTLTMKNGGMIIMEGLSQKNVTKFQTALMKMQLKIEDYFIKLAQLHKKPTVILFDRGVIDPKAYMDENCWQTIMNEQGWNIVQLRDKRYNQVLHLVTAADGAAEFYTSANNQARYEDLDNAIKTDQRTQNVWSGHPHYYIIDNSEQGFQTKINKVYETVARFLGIDQQKEEVFKKFLIEPFVIPKDINPNIFDVEEVFLKVGNSEKIAENKIRKRGQNNFFSYSHQMIKNDINQFSETKKNISSHDYMQLFEQRDPALRSVKKKRTCFAWEKQQYIIDEILEENKSIPILRIESINDNEGIRFPSFLKIIKEVTHEKEYTTKYFAEKQDN